MRKLVAALVVAAACVGVFAAAASADYGRGAYRQIELSANVPSPQGGGVWLWIGLNADHTGDYAGSDCGHGGQGAAADRGDVTWQPGPNDTIVISGAVLNGLPTDPAHGNFAPWQTTITVPAATGHYAAAGVGTYLTLPSYIPPFVGTSELQVAP